jgi:hypothetical protein
MKKSPFHVHALSPRTFRHAAMWSLMVAVLIVAAAAGLGRAAKNFRGALVVKPDVAIYLLLPEEGLGNTTLLRESEDGLERDYLADTKDGPKLVKLKRGEEQWYVALTEELHE